jgi:hypothetical protein
MVTGFAGDNRFALTLQVVNLEIDYILPWIYRSFLG